MMIMNLLSCFATKNKYRIEYYIKFADQRKLNTSLTLSILKLKIQTDACRAHKCKLLCTEMHLLVVCK